MEGRSSECGTTLESFRHPDWNQAIDKSGYYHGLITGVSASRVSVKIGPVQAVMTPAEWRWTGQTEASKFLAIGDVVYVKLGAASPNGEVHAELEQDSGAQASMLAVDNASGE